MLRLQKLEEGTDAITLVVEGSIVSPWLELLGDECRGLLEAKSVRIDLAGVTYVGPPGIRLLKELTDLGAELIGTPGIVRQMLDSPPPSH